VFTCETIATAKKEYDLYAPASQKVIEVLVKEGDFVQKGQELIRLDISGLENDMLQLELERQQTLDSKRYMSSKSYNLSMEAVDKKIESKQSEIDGSIIAAPEDGYVTALLARDGMTANTAEPLVTVGTVEDGLQAALIVTQKQATWFAKDDKVSIYIPILNQTFDGFVSRVKAAQDGNMIVLADISDPSGAIHAGQLTEISFTKMSGDYLTLIPISALHSDGSRDYVFRVETVQGPLGDEYRLYKIYVRVLDQDDTNAALETELNSAERIVTESDQELFGGRVKIIED
jgi:multidrug efflux pump subunit AcrA (membrane-fusion protein)